ncbi:MAG: SapC family protein [Rhodocyclaceae bacterium]|nr:SapC family protein [Rhodocyclaceae bacterium]
MSELLFYEKVEALNEQVHGALRVKPITNFRYAAKVNSVPLLVSEFGDCAREYPIVFVRGDAGVIPVALIGLREAENLFVDSLGKWDARYIPAFVRRYPFVAGKGDEGQMVVCIDSSASCFDDKTGEPLFADGKPTKQLDHAMNFMRDFQQGALATETISARLQSLDLFRDADSVARLNDGTQFRLNGMSVVDEEKLKALDKEVCYELFSSGVLGLIHAHLISLGNLAGLVDRLSKRRPAAKAAK